MEITFRKYQLSDVDHFMSWACDPEVLRYSKLKHWIRQNSSKQDILSYFTLEVIPHPWYRAICSNGQPVGSICMELGRAQKHHRGRAVISIALGRNYWGRGIATFAVRRATLDAFKEFPHLNRMEAFVNPENKASQRLVEKVGFLKEGVLRNYFTSPSGEGVDTIVYSLLPTDLVINAK